MISILQHQIKIEWYKPIRRTMLKQRIPQSVLAEKAGIANASLRKILDGKMGTRISTLFPILDALGMSLWMIDKDGNSWRLKP